MRIAVVALLCASAAATPSELVSFRLKKDPLARTHGRILKYDSLGFTFERLRTNRRVRLNWDDLVADDALAVRRKLGLALPEHDGPVVIKGHRIHFEGGATIAGLLVRIDAKKRHWIQSDGILLPYPGDRVERVEEVEVEETAVYAPDELYLRRLERTPPRTALEHGDLANYLYDVGNFEKSREHYRRAGDLDPMLRSELADRIERIDEILQNKTEAKVFRRAKRRARQLGDYEGARRILEDYMAAHPDRKRRTIRMLDEIEESRVARLQRRFHYVKHLEADRAIRNHLRTFKPDFASALAWLEKLTAVVERRVRARLRMSPEEYAAMRATRNKAAPHWASYWSGSWIVAKRTRKLPGRGANDPEDWWAQYDDVNTRASFLKAYAADRMPELFEIVMIRFDDCTRCGGEGLVTKWTPMPRGDQPQEWKETCPRCRGARRDRKVGYR